VKKLLSLKYKQTIMVKASFLFVVLIFLTSGCIKSANDTSAVLVRWNVTKVEGPNTGLVNQDISLTVYYPTSSGCDIFDKFEQSAQGNVISVKAFGHTDTGFCTQVALERTVIFNFQPNSTGIFEIRFINKDNSYLTHNLIIDQ
jgi:hypothetical protein